MSDEKSGGSGGGEVAYAYKPTLIGLPSEFVLTRDGLSWQVARQSGRVPFSAIRRVRMSYRPATLQPHRFVTEIWSEGNPRLDISSTSWRSMVEQERADAAYNTFITELHRRIVKADAPARLEQGSNAVLYWIGAALLAMAAVGLVAVTLRALHTQAWSGAVFIGALAGYLVWQGGTFFRRNRPGRYRADALPKAVMPSPRG